MQGEKGELGDSATRAVFSALEKKAAASETRMDQTNPRTTLSAVSGKAVACRKIHPAAGGGGRADFELESVENMDEVKAFTS